MLPHAFLRPFPMGLVPAAVSPRMNGMLHDLRIHQKFIAILLLPLVLLAALAAFTITLAGLANELQKERGLSAVYIGNPSSGLQNVNR
jgi:hypothetical protein